MNATLMRGPHHPLLQQGEWLGRVVRGYFNHHAIRGNKAALEMFQREVVHAQLDALRRRSQRSRMSEDVETMLEEVVAAMNQARPGHIIDDSEELVRAAAGEFRRRLFEKALELRGDSEAFSPSAERKEDRDSLE